MASLSGKRPRRDLESPVEPPGVASLRGGLVSRAARLATSRSWLREASADVADDTDACLLQLGRSIAAALQMVATIAEDARASLRQARSALHAAVDSRCDELQSSLNAAEAARVAILERELVTVDAALERWRSEGAGMCEAVAALSDAELSSQHDTLTTRLDNMESLLLSLPPVIDEPPVIGLGLQDMAAQLTRIAGFGRVLAPLAISATDLSLEGASSVVRPGGVISLMLTLGERHAAQCTAELELSLGRLVRQTIVEASLDDVGVALQPLPVTVASDAAHRCLVISMTVPSSASAAASICLNSLTVAGLRVPGLPLCAPLLRLEGASPDNVRALLVMHKRTLELYSRDSFKEAVALRRAILHVRERVQGPEHPDTLATKHVLAVALCSMGSIDEAVDILRALLPVRERVSGPEHPDVLATRHELAVALHSQGAFVEAVVLLRALLPVRERVLGSEHPDVLCTKYELAAALRLEGSSAEAVAILHALLPVQERVLGSEHPSTLVTKYVLAVALSSAGSSTEAVSLFRALLPVEQRVRGPEHPETLVTHHALAVSLISEGSFAEAVTVLRALLPVQERVLGPEHSDTLATKFELEKTLKRVGTAA